VRLAFKVPALAAHPVSELRERMELLQKVRGGGARRGAPASSLDATVAEAQRQGPRDVAACMAGRIARRR
jgi:hypothetical protein